jgi:hypothetical protein
MSHFALARENETSRPAWLLDIYLGLSADEALLRDTGTRAYWGCIYDNRPLIDAPQWWRWWIAEYDDYFDELISRESAHRFTTVTAAFHRNKYRQSVKFPSDLFDFDTPPIDAKHASSRRE